MSTNLVGYEVVAGRVALLTLNNPPLNVTRMRTIERLLELLTKAHQDPLVRTMVITGAGSRAFCVGSDINEFTHVREDVIEHKLARENKAFTLLEQLPIPTIAALNGYTLGGGAELALACDLRIMDEQAQIGFPEVKLGVFPGSGGLFRLPRLIGRGRALDLLYTGRIISSDEALQMGLIDRVASPGNALETALTLARELARGPAEALRAIGAGVGASFTQDTDHAVEMSLRLSDVAFRHPDLDAGITAFRERRPAVFQQSRGV